MAQHRTGLADLLFGGLIIGATAFFVALPGLCTPASAGTARATGAQVRHQATAIPAPALEVVGDPDDGESPAARTGRDAFALQATRFVRPAAGLAGWQHPDGISMARFLERAGRLACPSTAPPLSFG